MPNSSWTESGASIDLAPTTTPVAPGSSAEDVNYITNGDKIQLMLRYAAELATKTQLDTLASTWTVSSTAYDNAVAAINTTLTGAGAPANWATTWPDGTTSGPWPAIQTSLQTDWVNVATARANLQSAISAAQAGAAQTAAIAAAASQSLSDAQSAAVATADMMALSSPSTATWASTAKPALPSATYPAGSCWLSTDGLEFQVSANGNAWQTVIVAASGLFGKIAASNLIIAPSGAAINYDPGFADSTAWVASGAAVTFSPGPTGAPGAVGNSFIYATGPGDAYVQSARAYPIDPTKTYKLSALLYAASGNNRNMYVYVECYDNAGNYVTGATTGWGGTKSGYVYGAVPTSNATFNRYGAQFGAATSLPIPSTVATCKIGVWFQYSNSGSSNVEQAAQDLRLETVADASLIVDGCITAKQMAVSALDVGGPGSAPTEVVVLDNNSNWVAEVGEMSGSGPWGGKYGGWFKNLGIGGASPASPNLWVDSHGNIVGANGQAIDLDGNVKLKNTGFVAGVTANPAVATSWADLPELGSSDAQMTFALKGNPVLIAANLTFKCMTSSGSTGPVTSIGWIPSGNDRSSAHPYIAISISGDGSGASAAVTWSGGPGDWIPSLSIYGGSGYTAATATVTITNGDLYYANGVNTYTCAVTLGTPLAGAPIQVRVLMGGAPVAGAYAVTSDSAGNALLTATQLVFTIAGSHSFEVQAYTSNTTAYIVSTNRSFSLVELG